MCNFTKKNLYNFFLKLSYRLIILKENGEHSMRSFVVRTILSRPKLLRSKWKSWLRTKLLMVEPMTFSWIGWVEIRFLVIRFSKNSSNHIFAFLANFFVFRRILIRYAMTQLSSQSEASNILKSLPKMENIWFDEFIENTTSPA